MSLRTGRQWAVRLNEKQSLKVDALAFLWDCSPHDVVRRLLDDVSDPRIEQIMTIAAEPPDALAVREGEG